MNLHGHLQVAWRLALHDLRTRYVRSVAGPIWLLITPLGLLCIYGLVFGFVLNVRWPASEAGQPVGFVVPFFCGLSIFLMVSDMITSSVGLFHRKRNYVKKSPFPLWVIWLANYLRASIQGLAYMLILFAIAIAWGILTFSGFAYSLVALAVVFIANAGLSLIFAAIGPFAGDLAEAVRIALRLLFYSAPVTYPLALVPEKLQFILWLNPLTHMIEPLRSAVIYNSLGAPLQLAAFALAAALVTAAFAWVFGRVANAIPDVV